MDREDLIVSALSFGALFVLETALLALLIRNGWRMSDLPKCLARVVRLLKSIVK